ncbi:MAG TPA: A24 family peptidase [Dehalococcoidia bacterium]|nr:A24 family peptidase [Dehalococcoidia bacterium]
MTATLDSELFEETADRGDQKLLLLLTGSLLAVLLLVPFLPDAVAADTAARVFALLLMMIAAMDLLTFKVPNALVYPAIAFALAVTAILDPGLLPSSLAGGATALAIMVVLAVLQRGAMGMGDVKAACFSGCVLGIKGGAFSLLFGFVAAGIIALPIILLGLRSRKDRLPLAPFLVAGAFISYYLWGFLLDGSI